MREFKVGESVQDKNYGIGYVAAIDHTSYAPVFVEFLKGFSLHYHLDGRCSLSDSGPGLFHADEIPGQCAPASVEPMSRRDEFAIRIGVALIQRAGMIADNDGHHFLDLAEHEMWFVNESVDLADALIAELDRTSQKEDAK